MFTDYIEIIPILRVYYPTCRCLELLNILQNADLKIHFSAVWKLMLRESHLVSSVMEHALF